MDLKAGKKIAIIIQVVLVLTLIVMIGISGIYTVKEEEQAVITQFGKAIDVKNAGLHFKIPFVQNVMKVPKSTNGLELGYHTQSGQSVSNEAESFMITKDFNFVNVDFYIEWRVSDPIKYLFNSQEPELLLRNILQAEARSVVSGYDVDQVLTMAKVEIQSKIKENVIEKLNDYDLGIGLLNVSLQDAEPPTEEVITAFKDVENAKQNKDTEINIAYTYENQVIPQARADADKIIKEAEAIKEARVNEAIGQVARFNEMFEEYRQNKEITKTRMYLEAMEIILPGVKVIVSDDADGDIVKVLNLDEAPVTENQDNQSAIIGGMTNDGQ